MILIASATSFAHAREYMLAPWAVANYRKSPNGTAVGLLPTPTIDETGTMPELDHVSVHRS